MNKLEIKLAVESDKALLYKWLEEPGVLHWFPMQDPREVEDSVECWMSFIKQGAVWTAYYDGEPCGIANLYLHATKKLCHQALFAIIVAEKFRNKGIGTMLLNEVMKKAKDQFGIEILHLEVYEGNPAISLYQRLGFEEFGFHRKVLKEQDGTYLGKHMMQKKL